MGFSTPSTGQAGGASPLNTRFARFAVGSAPPPPAKPAEPPRSTLASLVLPLVQHPLHWHCRRSLPAQHSLRSFCRWFSTPSTGQACGASPLNTRFARFAVGSAPPPLALPAEPPRSTLASLVLPLVQHPLHRPSLRSLPAQHSRALVMGALFASSPRVGTLLSLLCLRRGVWGHSSRRFAFGGVSPILGQWGSDCSRSFFSKAGETILAIVFSKAGKTILGFFPRRGKQSLRSFFPRRGKQSLILPCAPSIRPP